MCFHIGTKSDEEDSGLEVWHWTNGGKLVHQGQAIHHGAYNTHDKWEVKAGCLGKLYRIL